MGTSISCLRQSTQRVQGLCAPLLLPLFEPDLLLLFLASYLFSGFMVHGIP
jgi:hypothetical protein